MSDPCKFEEKIIEISENIASMRADLSNAIINTTEHITAGSKYRLTIICTCIGLVGAIVGGIIRFSIMEYKVTVMQQDQDKMQEQIYDLNYEKGYAVGIADKQK